MSSSKRVTHISSDTEAWEAIGLCGSELRLRRHVGAFFHGAEERDRALLPFIREGVDRGDVAYHIVNPADRADHVRRLVAAGVDYERGQYLEKFEIHDWNETYFRGGGFDPGRMMAFLSRVLAHSQRDGKRLTRLISSMEWACQDRPGVGGMLEYESQVNLLPPHRDVLVCTFDVAKFRGDVILDALRAHPVIIFGGRLEDNPYYVPPRDFLRELRARRRPETS